jgi:anthranilate phosphoribosyltransferase
MTSWADLLSPVLAGESLSEDAARSAMAQIMSGDATSAQIAGLAVALRAKGESPEEVGGFVAAMLAAALPMPLSTEVSARAVDTCGTGGDRAHTVNISTMAALVVAGAGIPVVKHGGRASSSACGSADLLEVLGIAVDLAPADVARCVDEVGIGFCFAPVFHPALRHAATARRELAIPTIFNVLGPLTNPAQPGAQAVGVGERRLAPVMAQVLARRGCSALVFCGDDGLDELTPVTTSRVWVVSGGKVTEETFDPASVGVSYATPESLRGADAEFNRGVALDLLAGKQGPVRDAVILNAGAAIAAAQPSDDGLATRIEAGMALASEALGSGAAASVLERWRGLCGELRPQ